MTKKFRVLHCNNGGLIVQESHTRVDSHLLKDKSLIGTFTDFKDFKYPTKHGLLSCLVNCLMEEGETFGTAKNKYDLERIQETYTAKYEELALYAIEQMNENGWITTL